MTIPDPNPDADRVALARVVFNRMKSPRLPSL